MGYKIPKVKDLLILKYFQQRRSADSWKRKHDSVANDLENVIKEKYKLQEKIEHLNDDIASLKDNHSGELSSQEGEKSKLEQKLREANQKIKSLESQKKGMKIPFILHKTVYSRFFYIPNFNI